MLLGASRVVFVTASHRACNRRNNIVRFRNCSSRNLFNIHPPSIFRIDFDTAIPRERIAVTIAAQVTTRRIDEHRARKRVSEKRGNGRAALYEREIDRQTILTVHRSPPGNRQLVSVIKGAPSSSRSLQFDFCSLPALVNQRRQKRSGCDPGAPVRPDRLSRSLLYPIHRRSRETDRSGMDHRSIAFSRVAIA